MITITIKTDNAAFQDGNRSAETSRILRRLADQLEDPSRYAPASIYDVNGNTVGTVTLTGKDRSL